MNFTCLKALQYMAHTLDHNFTNAFEIFKVKLAAAPDFPAIRHLWSTTSIPYDPPANVDPFSQDYRNWVVSIYESMASIGYETNNELTSNKVDERQFKIGYPYVSGDPVTVGNNYSSMGHSLHLLKERPPARLAELGFGWGNLTHCLAKIGYSVTGVDIDSGFIERSRRIAEFERVDLSLVQSDFLTFSEDKTLEKFDAVIFNQSFHHCDNPFGLLRNLRENLLKETGAIYFFSEPITLDFNLPWGLRYDGEALWAISSNKWFELGYRFDFFHEMLFRAGFWLEVPAAGIAHVGAACRAVSSSASKNFGDIQLSQQMENGWYLADKLGGESFRFSRGESQLPSLSNAIVGATYELEFRNYAPHPLWVEISSEVRIRITLAAGGAETIQVRARTGEVKICSQVFVPSEVIGNGDNRKLGVALATIRIV
jgi:2-polyprenyl-3-methyl-5-hydroxy-6-metoxy-1,4-benzoquinol methylase